MIDISAAQKLLDFGARIQDPYRAREQLEGAVALHNMLEQYGVAYLADEVGMGKTYVALGTLALFRHYSPRFRVLVIAPRENIQRKWVKEFGNFVANNVRFPDLRVKGVDGRPLKPIVQCEGLLDFVREVSLDFNRDFFLRMTSFSLPVIGDGSVEPEQGGRIRDHLREYLPWVGDSAFDLRNKRGFKDNIARAICCALPIFDLVIVDEGHNLKHGFGEHSVSRNRVLALALGRDVGPHPDLFPGYGPRAKRVLFLSATPLEGSYTQLWNQLNVFGKGTQFSELSDSSVDNDRKRNVAQQFLIRRVTSLMVGGQPLTKNLYRREWRQGGVAEFDEPTSVTDPRQRLIIALVQKKVSELLPGDRFNTSFQIGMLASFESFLETAKLKVTEDAPNFDDPEQTDSVIEREGIDVRDLNRLASDHRHTFGREMPHPKMDSLVDRLSLAWSRGEKSLVFVRRVASVKEIKRKLDERYDEWLIPRLRERLPASTWRRFDLVVDRYKQERMQALDRDADFVPGGSGTNQANSVDSDDSGGNDTFFAWFFRGSGPPGIVSGANIQRRFISRGAAFATFFEFNYVADVLDCEPDEAEDQLAAVLSLDATALDSGLRSRARKYLGVSKKPSRAERFEAAQAAAIEWLKDTPGAGQAAAAICYRERFATAVRPKHAPDVPSLNEWLGVRTFYTELVKRPVLCERIWTSSVVGHSTSEFRDSFLRAQVLATAARLGHAFIDLYLTTIGRIGSLDLRAQAEAEDTGDSREVGSIVAYLDCLEEQMRIPRENRSWGAYDELCDIKENFELILDVNEPTLRAIPLNAVGRSLGSLFRQQQPTGGMAGQVNQTLVRQFRMPGYPLVLVTTELLQEGEDLHTFCSEVHHYGISWTPSAMEQRIGRIDRVRSHTERRLLNRQEKPPESELLQVYFPHLQDTIEVLQVRRVLSRMNEFLRLMHEGLGTVERDEKRIFVGKELSRITALPPAIKEPLVSAFRIEKKWTRGNVATLAVSPDFAQATVKRLGAIGRMTVDGFTVQWEARESVGVLLGTVHLTHRQQPFALYLRCHGSLLILRCISPVGRALDAPAEIDDIFGSVLRRPIRMGALPTDFEGSYDLTVEEEVILGDPEFDRARAGFLLRRVVNFADELENVHLYGIDQPLATFRSDLIQEAKVEG